MSLSVLVLEPFFTGSHEVWARGWQEHSRHDLHLLTQPGTHWRHRMMAASVPLAEATREHIERLGRPDVVVASDMVDLAGYLGLCRDELAGVPTVVYFHENQLTQPTSPNGVGGLRDRHLAWTNWRSLLAADEVWFNSAWQRDSMTDALEDLLAHGPAGDDQRPLLAQVRDRFRVRPVGCDLTDLLEIERPVHDLDAGTPPEPPLVLWNHRWAHDKGLDVAVASMRAVAGQGVDFRLAVVGTDDHHDPARGDKMLEPLGDRVVHRGWMEPQRYRQLLGEADVVVASARQENFGIAVVEAVAAGCVPVVPDALAYPESITDEKFRYPPGRLTTALRDVLSDIEGFRRKCQPMRESLVRFDWSNVAPEDDDDLEAVVATTSSA
ncbi:MAG: DUF3524 domain-containing protein [Microthrixaceae bacterium]